MLRLLVQDAHRNVAFYRKHFQSSGVVLASISTVDDLALLPFCDKTDLKKTELKDRLAENTDLDRLEKVCTSGSTGIPLQIAFSESEGARRRACLLRSFVDLGAPILHKRLTVKSKLRFTHDSLLRKLLHFNLRVCELSEAIEVFRQFHPYFLSGLPTQLHAFAQQIQTQGVEDIRPGLVVPSGEMILPDTERLLVETFQAPVRPYYGCWEFGVVAAWCDLAKGYHLLTDD